MLLSLAALVRPKSKIRISNKREEVKLGPADLLSADKLSRSVFVLLSDEGESFNPLKIDVFLQTLLSVASKSFSHSFSALGK